MKEKPLYKNPTFLKNKSSVPDEVHRKTDYLMPYYHLKHYHHQLTITNMFNIIVINTKNICTAEPSSIMDGKKINRSIM